MCELYLNKKGNQQVTNGMLSFEEINRQIWSVGADVFLPCAAARLVTRDQLDQMIKAGLEVISSGTNVPFADPKIFYGATYQNADERAVVIPDFIANCSMVHTFTLQQLI